MKFSVFFKVSSFLLVTIFFFIPEVSSVPINNRYDQFAIYTVFGTDKYYSKRDKFGMSIQLSPFYQHTSKARDDNGNKVEAGDMLGKWNMLALFFNAEQTKDPAKDFSFNVDGAPQGNTTNDFPYFSRAWRILDGKTEGQPASDTVLWMNGIYIPNPGTNRALKTDLDIDKNYTNPLEYDCTDKTTGYFSIPVDYEKLGLRGQLNFELGAGFAFRARGGIVDYTNKATAFTDQTEESTEQYKTNARDYIKNYLMSCPSYQQILKETGIRIDDYRETTFEDTHLQLDWSMAFDLMDKDDETILRLAPFLAVGCWLPTGKNISQDHAFSLPTGNDGHFGVTVEGSINFDFIKMIQLSFGGGVAFYETKGLSGFRVPTSEYQSGIYPWKTNVDRKPGEVWYANISMKAYDFIDNFSFFFDYIYTQHNKDDITIKECDTARASYFLPEKLEQVSRWKSNLVHAGINYRVTPGLEIGLSFNAHISGRRVYRTTTILGTMNFIF